jgi:hypothetical protein
MLQKLFVSALLATGLASALSIPKRANIWTPSQGSKWQIVLLSTVTHSGTAPNPNDAAIWDLDLFNTNEATISNFHSAGKKVICYFSAGTTEKGRPDLGSLERGDYGAGLPQWPEEKWLDFRSDRVWNIMKKRIELAAKKGCDAIDPDNMGKCSASVHALGSITVTCSVVQ